jgi:hypothetical protein
MPSHNMRNFTELESDRIRSEMTRRRRIFWISESSLEMMMRLYRRRKSRMEAYFPGLALFMERYRRKVSMEDHFPAPVVNEAMPYNRCFPHKND